MNPEPRRYACAALLAFLLSGTAAAEPPYWLPDVQAIQPGETAEQHSPYQIEDIEQAVVRSWKSFWSNQHATEFWNEEVGRLIIKYRVNPLKASRAQTLLHVAMHDAAMRAESAGYRASGLAAATHAAAAAMLTHLFPLEPPGRFGAQGESALAALSADRSQEMLDIALGAEIGRRVAKVAILRALTDGADEVWDARSKPSLKTAMWRPAPPLESAHPQEALAGQWRTWVLKDSMEIQPPTPPLLDPSAILLAAHEVLAVSRDLSAEQRAIADYWHLDKGTVTPSGLWNRKARELAGRSGMGERDRLRMLAALNVAMLDATLACWRAKYTWWIQRPITVIQENIDKSFMPFLVTPPHPSYVSGHASMSGAAAEVLKSFFTSDAPQIDAWAEEAAMSRLYGGIHYRADNDAGLDLGRRIGKVVIARLRDTPIRHESGITAPPK